MNVKKIFQYMIISVVAFSCLDANACWVLPEPYLDFCENHFDTITEVYCVRKDTYLSMNAAGNGDYQTYGIEPCAAGFGRMMRSFDDDIGYRCRLDNTWQDGIGTWVWSFGDGGSYLEWTWDNPYPHLDYGRGGSCMYEGEEGVSGTQEHFVNGNHRHKYQSTGEKTVTLWVYDDDAYEQLSDYTHYDYDFYQVFVFDMGISTSCDCIGVNQLIPVYFSFDPHTTDIGDLVIEVGREYNDSVKIWADNQRQTQWIPWDGPTPEESWRKVLDLSGSINNGVCYFEATSSGTAAVRVKYVINGGEEVALVPKLITVSGKSVWLEKLAADNSPDLDPGLICINAQSQYDRAKWKAHVSGGGTASVSSVGAVGVSFEGVGGSNPNALGDGHEFWAKDASETGTYAIKITHNECCGVNDVDEGTAFRFTVNLTDPEGDFHQDIASYQTYETWDYSPQSCGLDSEAKDQETWILNVVTDPEDVGYNKKVRVSATAVVWGTYDARIERNSSSFEEICGGFSVSLGGGLSIAMSVPTRTTGAVGCSGVGVEVSELNGLGPTTTSNKVATPEFVSWGSHIEHVGEDTVHAEADWQRIFNFPTGNSLNIYIAGMVAAEANNAHYNKARAMVEDIGLGITNREYEITE